MITDIFSTPFNEIGKQRIQFHDTEDASPVNQKKSFNIDFSQAYRLRLEKFVQLTNQIPNFTDLLVKFGFKNYIKPSQNAQYLTVKNSKNSFYGSTSILQNTNTFFKSQAKVADGISEIFSEDGSYLVGNFKKGFVQNDFLYILTNGDYIIAQKKKIPLERIDLGFRLDNNDSLESQQSDSDDDSMVVQDGIKVSLFQQKIPSHLSLLQCEVMFNGIHYNGQFKNGKLHGKVIETGLDYQFVGNYHMGQRKLGKFTSSFGFQYQGTFKNGKFQGLGTLKTKDGIYKGQFKNGLKDGDGQFKWPDNSVYNGQFKKDLRSGKGLFKSENGSFKGEWKDDQICGNGYLVVDGKGVGGDWHHNQYAKPTKFF